MHLQPFRHDQLFEITHDKFSYPAPGVIEMPLVVSVA